MKRLIERLEVRAGFWSLFDQGAVSLGNFLTQMLLARYLSWGQYGVFALVYAVLFFLIGSAGTLVTYPLSVTGGALPSQDLRKVTGISLTFNLGLMIPNSLIVLCSLVALHRLELFSFAVLALTLWQFQETLRRALMARLGHYEAVWGDSLSYLGQAVAIALLAKAGNLTLSSAFLAIAATSAAAAIIQVFQVKPRFGGMAECRTLAVEFWRLGGWASATSLINGATQQAFPWALGLLFGAAEAGSFQAIVNPLKVLNPLIVGTQNLTAPAAAKMQRDWGIRAASRSGLTYAAIGFILFSPFLLVMLAWPHAVLGLLYGFHSPYSRLEFALRICVLAYAASYWAEVVSSLLNGLGLPRAGFLAQLGATATAVVIGVPLTLKGDLAGAIVGLGMCAAVKAGIALCAVRAGTRAEGAISGRGQACLLN